MCYNDYGDVMENDILLIRKFNINDFNDLYEYLSDILTLEFEPYKPMNREECMIELERRINSDNFYAVVLKDINKVIGNIYFDINDNIGELGYVFNKKYWGNGYATMSCNLIIDYYFNKGLDYVFAECDPLNTNSWKLLERLNFIRTDYLKNNVYFFVDSNNNPIYKDTFVYKLYNKNK